MTTSVTVLTAVLAAGANELLPFADDLAELEAPQNAAEVSVMRKEIRIPGAARLAKGKTRRGLCAKSRAEGPDLVLQCESPKLHVRVHDGRATIYQLRGLPWAAADEPAPRPLFAPEQVGLGGACPGTTAAGRGECALAAGDADAAKRHFLAALETAHKSFAAMRLADLALEANRPLEAMEWLAKAGTRGEFGRLAAVRACELTDSCDLRSGASLFDPSGLPAPLRDELKLRELRLLRFEAPARAVAGLAALDAGHWPEGRCAGAPRVCRNVLLEGLVSTDAETRASALLLYAAGPVSEAGPDRPRLARAAADAAAALGAPQYAAALLAAATPDVPASALKPHLERVIELYLAAGETARASAVLAWGIDTVGPAMKRSVKRRGQKLDPKAKPELPQFDEQSVNVASELASAALTTSRARRTR
jgi:hypothetical protein